MGSSTTPPYRRKYCYTGIESTVQRQPHDGSNIGSCVVQLDKVVVREQKRVPHVSVDFAGFFVEM